MQSLLRTVPSDWHTMYVYNHPLTLPEAVCRLATTLMKKLTQDVSRGR